MADNETKPRRRKRPTKTVDVDDVEDKGVVKTRNKGSADSTKYVNEKKKRAKITVKKFDIPTSMLKNISDLGAPVDEDVTIKFSREGVYGTNRDIINSIAMWTDMDAPGYTYDGDDVSVCVNILGLAQAIRGTDKDDVSLVSIRDGSMFVSTHGVVKRLPVFVDGREAPPNTDDIIDMLPNEITVSTGFIKRFMSVAKDEEGALILSLHDDTFHMSIVDSMTDQENVTLDVPEDKVRDVIIMADSAVQLDVDLTFKVFGIISSVSKSVGMHTGSDMPIYVYSVLDNGYTINYIIAPRIIPE